MNGVQAARKRASRPVLVLVRDAAMVAATHAAARRARRAPVVVLQSAAEVLARLSAAEAQDGHLVCDPAAAGADWPRLLRTLAEPTTRTALILVGSHGGPLPAAISALAPAAGELHTALGTAPRVVPRRAGLPRDAAGALRRALERGAIQVSYQPVVSLHDRQPLLCEALARWPHQRRQIDPAAFVPLAESSGLAGALAAAVAARIAADMTGRCGKLPLGISLNLPLELVLRPDLATALRGIFRRSGMRPARLAIELTETAAVYNQATLRGALRRLAQAGHRVLLDDVLLDDPRSSLFGLPFAALKLDRSVVEQLPHRFAARRAVHRLVRAAHARGQRVIAEGVADARLWAAVKALGIDAAQGYLVGRPLPAAGIDAWQSAWRGGHGGSSQCAGGIRSAPPR